MMGWMRKQTPLWVPSELHALVSHFFCRIYLGVYLHGVGRERRQGGQQRAGAEPGRRQLSAVWCVPRKCSSLVVLRTHMITTVRARTCTHTRGCLGDGPCRRPARLKPPVVGRVHVGLHRLYTRARKQSPTSPWLTAPQNLSLSHSLSLAHVRAHALTYEVALEMCPVTGHGFNSPLFGRAYVGLRMHTHASMTPLVPGSRPHKASHSTTLCLAPRFHTGCTLPAPYNFLSANGSRVITATGGGCTPCNSRRPPARCRITYRCTPGAGLVRTCAALPSSG